LFRNNFDGVFLRCVEKKELEKVLAEPNYGDVRGHFDGDTTTHKVFRAGYYWPTLFKYAHTMAHKCVICQKATGRVKNVAFPLQPVIVGTPFQ
jgi:hypothetical protein